MFFLEKVVTVVIDTILTGLLITAAYWITDTPFAFTKDDFLFVLLYINIIEIGRKLAK